MTNRCDECGFEFDSPLLDEIHILARFPDRLRELLEGAGEVVYRRPAPETWSPNEYVWHMVDLSREFAEWLHMTRTRDCPTHAPPNADGVAEVRVYAERPIETGLWALQAGCVLLTQEAAIADPARMCVYKDWREVTAAEVIAFAAHEGAHHLVDLERALAAYSPVEGVASGAEHD